MVACTLNPAFDPPTDSTEATGSAATTSATEGAMTSEVTDGDSTGEDPGPLGDVCIPLAPPDGPVEMLGPDRAAELPAVIGAAAEGTTIVLLPGTYVLPGMTYIGTRGITVRSSTGNPADVVLDGRGLEVSAFLVQASDVTIAELTIVGPPAHGIHVTGRDGVTATGVRVYRVEIVDAGLNGVKANINAGFAADDGLIACSRITLTDAGRPSEGCGPTGVTGIGAAGWHVRDNHVEGFWCPGAPGTGIEFYEGSADNVIERNTIVDCAVGIRFGVYEIPPEGVRAHEVAGCGDLVYDHYGGLVRNNMIVAKGTGIAASVDRVYSGIVLWQICGTVVVHNTIVSAVEALSSLEYRFARSQAKVLNNLVTHPFRIRDEAGAPMAGNLEVADLSTFVDPLGGDVHILPTSPAVGAGVMLGVDRVEHDIDGDVRTDPPDVGADEL
jgi:hypothetical protein